MAKLSDSSRDPWTMAEPAARLYLITPVLDDAVASRRGSPRPARPGQVAAVLLRLPQADERTLVNQVKVLAPAVQEHGTALIVASAGKADLAIVAGRAGADGVHVTGGRARPARSLRERLKSERALGVGAHPDQGRGDESRAKPGSITCSSASRAPTAAFPRLRAWWSGSPGGPRSSRLPASPTRPASRPSRSSSRPGPSSSRSAMPSGRIRTARPRPSRRRSP